MEDLAEYGYQLGGKEAQRQVTLLASCVLCAKCYDDRRQPTFCQALKITIDPRALPHNEMRAQRCVFFKPYGFPQWAVALAPDEMKE